MIFILGVPALFLISWYLVTWDNCSGFFVEAYLVLINVTFDN